MKKKISISDSTIKLIEQKQIKPIPKWGFLIKNWSWWIIFLVSITVFVVVSGLVLFGLLSDTFIPYIWFGAALVLMRAAYIFFEHTKKAYKYRTWQVVTAIASIGLICGWLIYQSGFAKTIDAEMENKVPYYKQLAPRKVVIWSNPDSGMISGKIVKVMDDGFELTDYYGKKWIVSSKSVLIRGRAKIETGAEIKIIGSRLGESSFEAKEVRPWVGGGQNMLKEN